MYLQKDRVLRTVTDYAAEEFDYVRATGLIDRLISTGRLVAEKQLTTDVPEELAGQARYVLEHPRLPFISYPYEWGFSTLKAAALLQLDIQLQALDSDVMLTDASAYNIQFRGPEPVFIDHLSFRRYRDGEFWHAHGQFCEQFLNPLLLRAVCGIAHNAWYRGTQEGIGVAELSRVLPLRSKFSWQIFTQVVLQSRLQKAAGGNRQKPAQASQRKLPKASLRHMIESLRRWIDRLQPADTGPTVWRDYTKTHSYSDDEAGAKRHFIDAFARSVKPSMLWDIGCNTGEFCKVALTAGAELAIGFDFDQGALDLGFARARDEQLNFLPLFLDAANPPPAQGWAGQERQSLASRGPADGLLALALVHHLAISRNIPLDRVLDWLMSLAPAGVIEFVPKNDAMVQQLLSLREDIFPHYTEENFLAAITRRGRIIRQETVSKSGRMLVWYEGQK